MRISLFGFALLMASLHAAPGSFTTNLVPVADTTLRNGLSADSSFGTATVLPIGVSSGGGTINHGLFKFPLTAIPTNATITQVTLQFTALTGNASGANYNLFRALKDWDEAGSTWNTRLAPAISWSIAGGQAGVDYWNSISATAPVVTATVNSFNSAGIVADVQLWHANPSTNFGWFLIAANEQPSSGKQIASREDAPNSPVLSVTYILPTPLPAPTLSNVAIVDGKFRFSFTAVSNHAHIVEATGSLSPTNWMTLTNLSAFPTDTLVHLTNAATGTARYFRVGMQ